MTLISVPLPDADIAFDPHWMNDAEAESLCQRLRERLPWSVHRIRLFGRDVDSPRLSAWIGDPDAVYRYSGTRFEPHPWLPELLFLRDRLCQQCGVAFNSVLANLYRDGRDAMGWHSDDEPELGPGPVIASVSLGAKRRFLLKHRQKPDQRLTLELPSGSLLVMRGATQHHYRHALPRTARPLGERINLTFRLIADQRSARGGAIGG